MKIALRSAHIILVAATLVVSGCAELAYYGHAAAGQLEVMNNRRPIPEVIADPQTPAELRERLQYIEQAHAFAIHELHLPDTASYRSYSDVGRPYVLWNVFATPELSLQQKQWCSENLVRQSFSFLHNLDFNNNYQYIKIEIN